MAYLVLVRHGTSEYNAKGLWTGWTDVALNEDGIEEAKKAGEVLKNLHFDAAYVSPLKRQRQTLEIILRELGQEDIPITVSDAWKEKNFGDLTGKNKWEIKEQVGEEEFMKIRRSWDYAAPNGESLKDVYNRTVPYYEQNILPQLKNGKNIIISSSGNTLRSLVKFFENILDDDISKLEIAPGEVYVYTIDDQGKITNKEIRNQHENKV